MRSGKVRCGGVRLGTVVGLDYIWLGVEVGLGKVRLGYIKI